MKTMKKIISFIQDFISWLIFYFKMSFMTTLMINNTGSESVLDLAYKVKQQKDLKNTKPSDLEIKDFYKRVKTSNNYPSEPEIKSFLFRLGLRMNGFKKYIDDGAYGESLERSKKFIAQPYHIGQTLDYDNPVKEEKPVTSYCCSEENGLILTNNELLNKTDKVYPLNKLPENHLKKVKAAQRRDAKMIKAEAEYFRKRKDGRTKEGKAYKLKLASMPKPGKKKSK